MDTEVAERINRLIVVALNAMDPEDWGMNASLRQAVLKLKDGDLKPIATQTKHSNPHTARTAKHIADLIELQDAGVFPENYDLFSIIQSHHPITATRLWQEGCQEYDRRHQHDNDN